LSQRSRFSTKLQATAAIAARIILRLATELNKISVEDAALFAGVAAPFADELLTREGWRHRCPRARCATEHTLQRVRRGAESAQRLFVQKAHLMLAGGVGFLLGDTRSAVGWRE
jgi:hypothetical protein